MAIYRPAGRIIDFVCRIPELEPYKHPAGQAGSSSVPHSFLENEYPFGFQFPAPLTLSCSTVGWVGGEQRQVETWSAPPGTLFRVAGAGDYYIASGGEWIARADETRELTELDREILAGSALVFALALHGTWCLHASAVIYRNRLTVFLGESGQGKSTLAAFLATLPGWGLVADDILPVTQGESSVEVWPHFPQLKLSLAEQPGPSLPERLPLARVCLLESADGEDEPGLQALSPGLALRVLLGHTAGARLFPPAQLDSHLTFCAWAAERVPFYRLKYPHRREVLPKVVHLMENSC